MDTGIVTSNRQLMAQMIADKIGRHCLTDINTCEAFTAWHWSIYYGIERLAADDAFERLSAGTH
jgi:hypothetical protein